MTYRQIVVVDFSGIHEEEQQKTALREPKKLLIDCGEYKNAETAKMREDAATIASPMRDRLGHGRRMPIHGGVLRRRA